jgi:hypothetical protein
VNAFNAAGTSGCKLLKGFEKLFAGCDVVLVPDLDRPAFRDYPSTESIKAAFSNQLPGERGRCSKSIQVGFDRITNR